MTPHSQRVETARFLAQSGTYRYLIVRATGLDADEVGAIVEEVRPHKPPPPPDRCKLTKDMFGETR